MPTEKGGDARHEKALDKAEEALEALTEGDQKKADRLVRESKGMDPAAVEEVLQDLDEDAGSNPKAAENL